MFSVGPEVVTISDTYFTPRTVSKGPRDYGKPDVRSPDWKNILTVKRRRRPAAEQGPNSIGSRKSSQITLHKVTKKLQETFCSILYCNFLVFGTVQIKKLHKNSKVEGFLVRIFMSLLNWPPAIRSGSRTTCPCGSRPRVKERGPRSDIGRAVTSPSRSTMSRRSRR